MNLLSVTCNCGGKYWNFQPARDQPTYKTLAASFNLYFQQSGIWLCYWH